MHARSERLRELYLEELSRALPSVKDPGLKGFLTLTGVELSEDGKRASVYYSILGSAQEKKAAARALERAAPYLRQVLRKRLTVKFLPEFSFVYDDTPRKASLVDKMLLRIERERQDRGT
ncbi:MAG: 30S ribosome-binding factor RbfA [Elusimicrobia bacterium]|nr:30S ribosome-binding factor RbfA [Elusimicrobiota bacterium]MDE2236672.1 30S ribosome-binding factor RbfA [Elusimicrobiota bacterium]MDE2425471.1 30S ribosome-binding factor RbfA [Elusimicrobiota bacterium]